MDKSINDRILNALFIVLVGLTFLSLFKNIVWLSCILAAMFLFFIGVHIRDYKKENPKSKKIFVFTLIILINFFLANAVVVIAEYVYPY